MIRYVYKLRQAWMEVGLYDKLDARTGRRKEKVI